MSKKVFQSLYVSKHVTKEESERETTFTVTLKTLPTNPLQTTITVKSEEEAIFKDFPLNDTFEVNFVNPQLKLGED